MAVFTGNGAVATPSFTFSSDTDLGLYRFSSNTLGIAAQSENIALMTKDRTRIFGNTEYTSVTTGTDTLAVLTDYDVATGPLNKKSLITCGLRSSDFGTEQGWVKFGADFRSNFTIEPNFTVWQRFGVAPAERELFTARHLTDGSYIGLPTSTGGIVFNGDAFTAANALDDYEEGTHISTVTCGTSGTITLNAANQRLYYVKVGGLVSVGGSLSVSSISSPVGYFEIDLPFTVSNTSQAASFIGISVIVNSVNSGNVGEFVGRTIAGTNKLRVHHAIGTSYTNASAQEVTATSVILFSFSYFAG